jgi:WD40 repeat protein
LRAVSLLADDSWVATLGNGRSVKFWRAGAQRESTFVEFDRDVLCVAFSPASREGVTPPPVFAAVALADRTIRILEDNAAKQFLLRRTAARGRPRRRLNQGFLEVAKLVGHTGSINSLAFSTDGAELASASSDGTVRVWDCHTWMPSHVTKARDCAATAICLTADESHLVAGYVDGTVVVSDRNAVAPLATIRGRSAAVLDLSAAKGSNWLAATTADKSTVLWSLGQRSRKILDLPSSPGRYARSALSADGRRFAITWGTNIKFWDASTFS